MKPLNLRPLNLSQLTRGMVVNLNGVKMEYLTCDTMHAMFRRVANGAYYEFVLTRENDIVSHSGSRFFGATGNYDSAPERPDTGGVLIKEKTNATN